MAAFLYRMETLYTGSEPEFSLPSTSPFVDVSPGHVFYKQIVWLAGTGITTGYADGTFRPSQPVLREQMAAFICRFDLAQPCADVSEDIGGDPFQVFVDVPPGHTFFDAIFVMFAAGISTGYADGTYRPSQPVLREQMAAFLTRYINLWSSSSTATDKPSPEALIR
ncbi:S-layer homology domain-containing protein [Aeromicrobium alkaliterrae]|uniref:SLH domain-containing protein n=1 Tax=Aeromicrobium alkaliterrae TaxID=302168 RepID=A0ABN2JGK9_9ACTN